MIGLGQPGADQRLKLACLALCLFAVVANTVAQDLRDACGEVVPGAVGSGIAPLDGSVPEPEKVCDSGSEKHQGAVVSDGGESHYSLLRGVVMFLSGMLLYRVFVWRKTVA